MMARCILLASFLQDCPRFTMGEPEAQTAEQDTEEKKRSGKNEDSKEAKKESDGDDKSGDLKEDDEPEKSKPKGPPLYKKPAFIIIAAIVAVVLIVGGIILWLILRQYAWTDDAYVDGHVIQISPQVGAQVQALHIEDNQLVRKGDLLIQLDPTDYLVALQQAKAQVSEAVGRLAQARAQIESAKAAVLQAVAQEHSSQASFDNSARDFERYAQVDERARSRQQLDNAGTTLTNARAQLEVAQARVVSAKADVATSEASAKAAEGDLQAAQANQRRAEVNLGYCDIYAPCDGRVTERTVEAGNYVAIGQAMFLLVDPNVWVTANFKETQLTYMRPGQPVTITIDAFPKFKFHGRVDSIQAGSGSRFSVLPAENATGNFVKIVQRVPVKILFDHDSNTNDAPMLSPGLSVIPRVKVR